MPIFRPRTRIEILREMMARVVGRSRLSGLRRNGFTFHVLSSAATEDAELYFQLARLREIFDLENATGSDLDERAQELIFSDEKLLRIDKRNATSSVIFGRTSTVGAAPIPIGSYVAASDSAGQILYKTTAAGSILNGNTESSAVPIVAVDAGIRANVDALAVSKLVSRPPGVLTVRNTAKIDNGVDKEKDPVYRARLKGHVQSLSRGTPFAVESFVGAVQLTDGQRVRYSKMIEPVVPNGTAVVYVDDGTGGLDVYDSGFLTSPDTLIASAAGGEERTRLSKYAVRDDGSFVLKKNGVVMVRNTDYFLNRANGEISFAVALTAGQAITVLYRYYTGLVYEAQLIVSGKPDDRLNYPGVGPASTEIRVLPAARALQTLVGQLSVLDDFDVSTVSVAVASAIQTYINNLSIGEAVLVSKTYAAADSVAGVADFAITSLSGSSPAVNQTVLPSAVARILSAGITIV